MELTKLCIGIPSMGFIKTFTVNSMVDIMANTKAPSVLSTPVHTYLHEARRHCVEDALSTGCSHLLFLDSDMVVEGEVVNKLVSRNKPVIGAKYNERRFPLLTTVKIGKNKPENVKAEDMPREDVFECLAVGTGCMLIDLSIIKHLKKPWFFYSYFQDGKMDYGEDVWFCERVRKAGYKVWCDQTIQIKHMGDYGF